MHILHIIDDQKFIDICKKTFEIEGVDNNYLNSKNLSLEYFSLNTFDVIFIHFLNKTEVDFFSSYNINIPKIWMFWGADGFILPKFYNKFLDRKSKNFLFKIKLRGGILSLIKHFIKLTSQSTLIYTSNNRKLISVINDFQFIVPIVPGDYKLLCEKYRIKPDVFHFNYVIPLNDRIYINRERINILLGNSSYISNNHIEILDRLNRINLENRKVYVPLNYGNEEYKRFLINYMKKSGNKALAPLIEFMEYKDYSEIISSCRIMIMNHHRQQALGNIILGLTNGCTIYMNKVSTLYKYLISHGFIIRSVEDLEHLNLISQTEELRNHELAHSIFGSNRQKKQIIKLLRTIVSE